MARVCVCVWRVWASLTQISQRGLLIKFPRACMCVCMCFLYLFTSLPLYFCLSLFLFRTSKCLFTLIFVRVLFLLSAISRASEAEEAFGAILVTLRFSSGL